MRSRQLEASLTEFAEQAAARLHADVRAGQEVPFELESRSTRRRGASPLYCYRPLTSAFLAERIPELRRLPAYGNAVALLELFDGLDRYLIARDVDRGHRGARSERALFVLLKEIFEDQTTFELRPERLERALAQLDDSALATATEITLVASFRGLTIASQELPLTRGLLLAQQHALHGAPEAVLRDGDEQLLVVYNAEAPEVRSALAEGIDVVHELLRALRLYGDGRITLGSLAFTRVGSGPWSTIALGGGGRPHGMLVVTAEQEDELRAFCNLISRRAPHASEIAWALARFEMGCERASEYEAISDNLLALRALLSGPSELEPEGSHDGVLAGRLAALCATVDRRAELAERTLAAIALEREVIVGAAVERAGSLALARELANHLRALLRDVICGHLPGDLASLADELLLSGAQLSQEPAAEQRQAGEIVHLAV